MIIPGDIGTLIGNLIGIKFGYSHSVLLIFLNYILIDFFGFTSSIFYCAAMVALIVMRFTRKNEPRPIKVKF